MSKPAWYDKAKQMMAEGKTNNQIGRELGISGANITMVLGPNADAYDFKDAGKQVWRLYGFDRRPTIGESIQFLKDHPEVREDIMSDRTFQAVSEVRNGVLKRGVQIVCTKREAPDCEGSKSFFNVTGKVSYVHAAGWFRNHGWSVGGGPRADICPKCMAFIRNKNRQPEPEKPAEKSAPRILEAKPVETPKIEAPKVEPKLTAAPIIPAPRPPLSVVKSEQQPLPQDPAPIPAKHLSLKDIDRTAKRLIDAKLDEVYDSSKGGYLSGWSDKRVASEEGVMVEWVALVRDFGHGPNTTANDYSKEMKAMQDLHKAIKESERIIVASTEKLAEFDRIVNERLAHHKKLVDQFNDAYNLVMRKLAG